MNGWDVLWQAAANWGPAVLVFAGFIFLAWKLIQMISAFGARVEKSAGTILNTAFAEFIANQKAQTEAMRCQADSLRELASVLQVQRAEASGETREMMILTKVLRGEVEKVGQAVGRVEKDLGAVALSVRTLQSNGMEMLNG